MGVHSNKVSGKSLFKVSFFIIKVKRLLISLCNFCRERIYMEEVFFVNLTANREIVENSVEPRGVHFGDENEIFTGNIEGYVVIIDQNINYRLH